MSSDSIFISYRRAGTSGYGGRLQEDLRDRFGKERVFRDIDSIRPGSDFTEVIERAVAGAAVVLVLIGRNWLGATNESGVRRLEDPDDFVRLEVESALRQDIFVVPVLVEGARMPSPSELPSSIERLGRTQAIELTDERWDYDLGRLVAVIEELVAESSDLSEPASAAAPSDGAAVDGQPGRRRRARRGATASVVRLARVVRRRRLVAATILSAALLTLGVLPVVARAGQPTRVEVPGVVNLDATGATKVLELAGFKVRVEPVADDSKPGGIVLGQDPPGGSRPKKGSLISLRVSGNTNKLAVPSVLNLLRADAVKAIEVLGLLVAFDEKPHDVVGAGTVFAQSPEATVAVDKGTTVIITVSTGAAPSGPSGLPELAGPGVTGGGRGVTTTTAPPTRPSLVTTTSIIKPKPPPPPPPTPTGCTTFHNVIEAPGNFETGFSGGTKVTGSPTTRVYNQPGTLPHPGKNWVGSTYATGGSGGAGVVAVLEIVGSLALCPDLARGGKRLHYGGFVGGDSSQRDTVNLELFFRAGTRDIPGCGVQTGPDLRVQGSAMKEWGLPTCAIPTNADHAGIRVYFTSDGIDSTADAAFDAAYIYIG